MPFPQISGVCSHSLISTLQCTPRKPESISTVYLIKISCTQDTQDQHLAHIMHSVKKYIMVPVLTRTSAVTIVRVQAVDTVDVISARFWSTLVYICFTIFTSEPYKTARVCSSNQFTFILLLFKYLCQMPQNKEISLNNKEKVFYKLNTIVELNFLHRFQ